MPVRTTPAQIRKMFRLTVTEMEHQIGRFVKRPGKDFTRHRICTFPNTILAIMTMEAHSLKRELFEYFRPLKGSSALMVGSLMHLTRQMS